MDRTIGFGIMVVSALYVLSPIDVVPDFVPLLGQADDVAVGGLGFLAGLFILLTGEDPREV